MSRKKEVIEPWERQPEETEKAYEAFLVYKNLGPGRTFTAVSRRLQKSGTLIQRWKNRYNWEQRAAAFDRENERKEQLSIQKARAQMIKNHIGIARSLQGKAIKALEAMDPDELKPGDIRDFLRFGVSLEKETRADIDEQKGTTKGQDAAQMLAAILEKAWGGESDNGES